MKLLINSPSHDKIALIEELATKKVVDQVEHFHQSLPGYQPTPLVSLDSLSSKLGLNSILVKDESKRFELNAFKLLGASFAIAKSISLYLGFEASEIDYPKLIAQKARYQNTVFATATDGNHGRAVAWVAKMFGCTAKVYMPKGSANARLEGIKRYTDDATITDLNYDETVSLVSQLAQENSWRLIQDTAWGDYLTVPKNIMQGYFSLIQEYSRQTEIWPTHVLLQAGVGSMAAAIVCYFIQHRQPTPIFILVEPNNAPCFYYSMSMADGKPHQYGNLNTIMAGLACGNPSELAWDILSKSCSAFVSCDDEISIQGMKRYANPLGTDLRIVSGESGAVTLGVIQELMTNERYRVMRDELALNQYSNLLLLSTEGDTDPQFYKKIVQI